VAVALAGPYADHLYLPPDRHRTSSLNFYRPDALLNNQPVMYKH